LSWKTSVFVVVWRWREALSAIFTVGRIPILGAAYCWLRLLDLQHDIRKRKNIDKKHYCQRSKVNHWSFYNYQLCE